VKQVVRQLVPGLTAREVRHLLARVHLWDSGGEAALTLPELQAALTSSTAPPPKRPHAPREPLVTPPRGEISEISPLRRVRLQGDQGRGGLGYSFTVQAYPSTRSAAQGSLTSCLNFDFAILNLFEPSAPMSDGPEVEHGAHFLILYYPSTR
jgi:hypothetical protein